MTIQKWAHIQPLGAVGKAYDFTEIGSLQRQWLAVKTQIESSTPESYDKFSERLARRWAIETGILEGLYTLDRGITEVLVERGIVAEYISAESADRNPSELVDVLKDHEKTSALVHDWIKNAHPLSTWFIKQLHITLTEHQPHFRAVDQFGRALCTELHRGEFKKSPNNPTRPDGVIHQYCPPEHVDSEIDTLLRWHSEYTGSEDHPILLAAWLHHRFLQVHPFEDGNGRVARALLTWELVRKRFLPIVISRDERTEYIDALERADEGNLIPLVDLFVRLQATTIMQALSIGEPELAEVGPKPLVDQVIDAIVDKVQRRQQAQSEQMRSVNHIAEKLRDASARFLESKTKQIAQTLKEQNVVFVTPMVDPGGPDKGNEYWYRNQVRETARRSQHWVNFHENRYFTKLSLNPLPNSRSPRLVFVVSLYHVGRQLSGVMAGTSFAEVEYGEPQDTQPTFTDCTPRPLTFTWNDDAEEVSARFSGWIEESFSLALKRWADFL